MKSGYQHRCFTRTTVHGCQNLQWNTNSRNTVSVSSGTQSPQYVITAQSKLGYNTLITDILSKTTVHSSAPKMSNEIPTPGWMHSSVGYTIFFILRWVGHWTLHSESWTEILQHHQYTTVHLKTSSDIPSSGMHHELHCIFQFPQCWTLDITQWKLELDITAPPIHNSALHGYQDLQWHLHHQECTLSYLFQFPQCWTLDTCCIIKAWG